MKQKKMAQEQTAREQLAREVGRKQRYVLIGAALGLYYGIFYRPTDTAPDYGIAILLSIVAALVTVTIRFWGKKQSFRTIAESFVRTFLFYAVFLVMLAVRKLAEQVGGRGAVTVLTTATGIGLAYVLAARKGPF